MISLGKAKTVYVHWEVGMEKGILVNWFYWYIIVSLYSSGAFVFVFFMIAKYFVFPMECASCCRNEVNIDLNMM